MSGKVLTSPTFIVEYLTGNAVLTLAS